MIINDWDPAFTKKYGTEFPRSYLCVDTEFTGSNEQDDLILEIGHTMIEDGKIVDELNVVLDWYPTKHVQESWLDYKLNTMRHNVGTGWRLTPAVVRQEGMDPIKALKFYYKLFAAWSARGLPFVAQNGMTADERLLRGNFNRFLGKPFAFPENGYFDTGGLYKANRIWSSSEDNLMAVRGTMLPHRSDTLKAYFHRVIYTRCAGVKWNMKAILDEYNLREKHKLRDDQFHTAGFDSKCLHYIMEEFRKEVKPTSENVTSPVQTLGDGVAKQEDYEKAMATYRRQDKQAKSKAAQEEPKINTPAAPRKKGKKRKRKQRLI
tara:strand:+ start:30261 stop:31220 length:960 start_codon:yes stop_codon:yes gene_type:complete